MRAPSLTRPRGVTPVNTYQLSHLSDGALLSGLRTLVARDRETTAALLAHIAEVDQRKLYLPAAYPSMYAYCVGELHLCEQAAFKRIRAARTASQFPAIFEAVADGRLHLSAVVLLTPHLRPENVQDLLAAATHKSKAQVEQMLAERFPLPDLPAWVVGITPPEPAGQLSPGTVESQGSDESQQARAPLAPECTSDRPRVRPLAPQRFAVQFTMGQEAHDLLRHAQALLGHHVPTGDIAAVVERALKALVAQLEKQKCAATSRPRHTARPSSRNKRHIPAHVKRTVWERDGGQCTFVSDTGQRCPARNRLEFDHVQEVARGGEATVSGARLRCRAHNQYGAERTFGAEFMRHKRLAAAETRAAAKVRRVTRGPAGVTEQAATTTQASEQDVVPWLRALGFRTDEVRRAAAYCQSILDASLEERLRLALSFLAPPHRKVVAMGT